MNMIPTGPEWPNGAINIRTGKYYRRVHLGHGGMVTVRTDSNAAYVMEASEIRKATAEEAAERKGGMKDGEKAAVLAALDRVEGKEVIPEYREAMGAATARTWRQEIGAIRRELEGNVNRTESGNSG